MVASFPTIEHLHVKVAQLRQPISPIPIICSRGFYLGRLERNGYLNHVLAFYNTYKFVAVWACSNNNSLSGQSAARDLSRGHPVIAEIGGWTRRQGPSNKYVLIMDGTNWRPSRASHSRITDSAARFVANEDQERKVPMNIKRCHFQTRTIAGVWRGRWWWTESLTPG